MGLRINTNVPSLNAQRRLRETSGVTETAMERLASGNRINKSSDDVAGLAISENMRGQLRGLAQAQRNAQDGISFLQVAEGGLNESSNILIRIRELATESASDTVGDKERGFINTEVQNLLQEMDRIANTTEYSGTNLLNGTAKKLDFHVGTSGNAKHVISYDASEQNATASALDVSGLSVASKGDARSALDASDQALTKIGTMRANLGAVQSRLGSTINNLSVYQENLAAANSRIKDADIAEESSNLAKGQIIQQAGIATLSQANNHAALALKLI